MQTGGTVVALLPRIMVVWSFRAEKLCKNTTERHMEPPFDTLLKPQKEDFQEPIKTPMATWSCHAEG